MYAFTLTAENAELFFEVCHELKANTEIERIRILEAMAKLGKVNNIVKTKLNKQEYIKHLSKHFKCAIVKSNNDAQHKEIKQNG